VADAEAEIAAFHRAKLNTGASSAAISNCPTALR
jgi:hypothetical protein